MSWLRFSLLLSAGVLLVGLSSTAAISGEAPLPRGDRLGRRARAGRPGPPRPVRPIARRPQTPRGNQDGPPGPEARGDARGGQPQPPGGFEGGRMQPPFGPGGGPFGGLPPGGPGGDRSQPPGPPLGYPPRGRHGFRSAEGQRSRVVQGHPGRFRPGASEPRSGRAVSPGKQGRAGQDQGEAGRDRHQAFRGPPAVAEPGSQAPRSSS